MTVSPRLLKAGLVLLDAETLALQRVITLQYSPDTLTRSLQPQGTGDQAGDRSEALRLKGPPVETIRLEAELDATDQLATGQDSTVQEVGLQPQLAVLELLVYPASADLQAVDQLARSGALEVAPTLSPLTLFVWSKNRILPVRVTECSVTEEAFDPHLNPIRAKVTLGLRVLSVNDLGFDNKGGALFLVHHQQKERLAARSPAGAFRDLGIGGVP